MSGPPVPVTPALPPSPRLRLVGHLLFWPVLAAWTFLLLKPNPVPEPVLDLFHQDVLAQYVAAKLLHASGYAWLAYTLGLWTPRRHPHVTLAAFLLLAHAVGTEWVQEVTKDWFHRTGVPSDVVIDWTGIAVGVLIGRRHWRGLWTRG